MLLKPMGVTVSLFAARGVHGTGRLRRGNRRLDEALAGAPLGRGRWAGRAHGVEGRQCRRDRHASTAASYRHGRGRLSAHVAAVQRRGGGQRIARGGAYESQARAQGPALTWGRVIRSGGDCMLPHAHYLFVIMPFFLHFQRAFALGKMTA